MFNVDFLNFKSIVQYLFLFAITLVLGVFLKDLIAIVFTIVLIFYAISKNIYKTVEVFIIWLFVCNFFIGQGCITISVISKYIAKPSFLLFLIFFFFFEKIPSRYFKKQYVLLWLCFLFIILLGSLFQNQSPFVIISQSSFFLIYFLLQAKGIKQIQYQNLLNLFVAAAILQTIVSFFQVSGLIPPPSTMMDDGSGGQFEWVAGLDDAASGTFGPVAGHITSWYSALISLFLIFVWAVTKEKKYLIVMGLVFLQFAMIDSKTIMGVTVLMLGYTLFYLYKERKLFRLSVGRYYIFIFLIGLGSLVFFKAWDAYYAYYGAKTGGARTGVSVVFESSKESSTDVIIDNIGYWGKFCAYQNIFDDFIKNDQKQLIWGYGIQGYTFNGKMGYIESKDIPIMQVNNLTNSRSGLITQFATSGLLGMGLFVYTFFIWYWDNIGKRKNNYDLIKNGILKIYLIFTFLAAFLYSITSTTIPFIVFAAIISIYSKLSQFHVRCQYQSKQKLNAL